MCPILKLMENTQPAKTSKYSREIKMILKVWVILPPRMHREIIQTEKKMYVTLRALSVLNQLSSFLKWNNLLIIAIQEEQKQHHQSHTLNVTLTADACGQ